MPETEADMSKLFRTTEELLEPEENDIQGSVPEWVNGTVLRVGPGKFDFNNFTVNHWLDGYAILSKFEIKGSKVKFSKRFLQSDAYMRANAAQKPVITEFGTKAYPDPNKNILSRIMSSIFPEMTDNDSNNIFQLGKDFFTANDSCFVRKIDPCSLDTGGKFDSNKYFGLNGISAHPLTDEDGNVFNIGFSVLTGLKFSVIKMSSADKSVPAKELMKDSKSICSIPSSYGGGCISYVHSFGMTKNYIVFVEQPYVASISAIAAALIKGHSVKDWLEWRPQEKNRFHIIDKSTGKVLKTDYYSKDPFFFLHFINCHETKENEIVVDLIAINNPDILDGMYLSKLRNNIIEKNEQPSGRRFVIPMMNPKEMEENINLVKFPNCTATAIRYSNTIVITPEILTESGCEMPVINKKYQGKKHAYFYANGTIAENSFSNAICKVNLDTKSTLCWKGSEHMYPGEPVFVPRPGATEEDDGILISAVSNVRKGEDDILVFINAKNMTELGISSFKNHIPSALHGVFIPNNNV